MQVLCQTIKTASKHMALSSVFPLPEGAEIMDFAKSPSALTSMLQLQQQLRDCVLVPVPRGQWLARQGRLQHPEYQI